MGKTPFERDSKDLGFTVTDTTISGWGSSGPLHGARAVFEQSMGAPSRGARMVTSIREQGKLQGRPQIFVTVTCLDGTTIIAQVKGKLEMTARRWVAAFNQRALAPAQTTPWPQQGSAQDPWASQAPLA